MKETKMSGSRYFKGLDTLRFGAFLLVFFFHSTRSFPIGYTGVMFFFVISSFLLTYLALEEIDNSGTFHPVHFLIRRALRIYPLYYLVIGFAFFVLPYLAGYFNKPVSLPVEKWRYWLFLSNYDTSSHVFFLKQLWSIAVEEQFYLAFAVVGVLFRKYIFLICIAGTLLYLAYTGLGHFNIIYTSYFGTIRYVPCFVTGILCAKVLHSYPNKVSLIAKWLLSISILLIPPTFLFPSLLEIDSISFSLFFGWLLLQVINNNTVLEGKYSKWIHFSEFWGKRTYGLYVYSGLVITLNITTLQVRIPVLKQSLELLLLFLITYLSYRYFEKPLLDLKRKWAA